MPVKIKTCPVCGEEFETKNIRKMYCSIKCNNKVQKARRKERLERRKKEMGVAEVNYPKQRGAKRYSPEKAQATHDRQAEIERKARAAGMSYGQYQYKKYLAGLKGAE